ncbi:MAG TPA: M1 family aminopeptidase [Terriglobales bacterium]|nr:M1 family aminopeptidase [Terriglobales bacterium]
MDVCPKERSCTLGFRYRAGLKIAIFLLPVVIATSLFAATISGTVKDPNGAVIVGAKIEITGGELTQPLVLTSDAQGRFVSPDLKPGKYSVRVSQAAFETREEAVDLSSPVQLELTLAIAVKKTTISTTGTPLAYANADPFYKQLRQGGLGQSFQMKDLTVTVDSSTFHFLQGTFTFLAPVNGAVVGAVFIGEGHFTLTPVTGLDRHELNRRIGADQVDEDFTEVVLRFTNDARMSFIEGLGESVPTPAEAASVLQRWREKMRQRREIPEGFSEAILHGSDMDNVDADALATIYNPAHPMFLNAYIRGKKHKDLRFFMRMRVGALPQLDSPEEVTLINYDPGGMSDGVWYLAHTKAEYLNGTANSAEERRLFATRRYKIETVIGKNQHLFSTATISFEPLVSGERVLKFDLLPNLRVSQVLDEKGQNLNFIQEDRKQDGSFYVVLPEAPAMGQETSVTVEYSGDKVIENAGGGSYYVQARSSWYPNLNGFGERSIYDLTFKVPRKFKLISVGELKQESLDQDLAVTHWVTPLPVAVAGFNYGDYQKIELDSGKDDKVSYKISGYYLSQLPDSLSQFNALKTLAPRSMTEFALQQTRAQLQICTFYFGKSPYDSIYITEQPNFSFGQSWPYLVYLPISAYTDSTQRYMLFGGINSKLTGFVDEVTPHEVSHQWWGHAVGWASYHDQWLSEGFAEFSAGLFTQFGYGNNNLKDYLQFWDRLSRRILDKNNFGFAPNDAGPIWMGTRLGSPKTENAYQNLVYPKGAYILQMLRSIMYSPGDKEFIEMMHDFVESHRDRPATTESFKKVVERHMTKTMDLQGNGSMDWFFREWVYGTEIPKYRFEYHVTPADGGKFKLSMTVTQSEVSQNFAMLVPVFADFGKGMVRIGQVAVVGNSNRNADVLLPMEPKKVALNPNRDILER